MGVYSTPTAHIPILMNSTCQHTSDEFWKPYPISPKQATVFWKLIRALQNSRQRVWRIEIFLPWSFFTKIGLIFMAAVWNNCLCLRDDHFIEQLLYNGWAGEGLQQIFQFSQKVGLLCKAWTCRIARTSQSVWVGQSWCLWRYIQFIKKVGDMPLCFFMSKYVFDLTLSIWALIGSS